VRAAEGRRREGERSRGMRGQIFSWMVSVGEVIDTLGTHGTEDTCFGCTIPGSMRKDCDLVRLGDSK
jgi:hypothetical protein